MELPYLYIALRIYFENVFLVLCQFDDLLEYLAGKSIEIPFEGLFLNTLTEWMFVCIWEDIWSIVH